MKVKVYNQTGEQTQEEVELNPKIFAVQKIKPDVVHFVATALLSNARNTVASTKTRGEVRGGGRKPWQQKGTGRARHGSIRSPLWRGGGITFGPRPNRNFYQKVNRKARRLGIFSVLTDKRAQGRLVVLENLELEAPKTRELLQKLENLKNILTERKVLLVVPEKNEKIVKAARNLPNIEVSLANNLNLLQLLWTDNVVILKNALPVIEKTYLTK
ncbi:MAG: 50S ribosomal protein L4 [Candidatus Doudnabacteria bacterium]|nr:50S ribosomal protein L4 [Candidatus Doudnabacteria bacterium]